MDTKKELILNASENLNWGLCPISCADANGESEREKERGEREIEIERYLAEAKKRTNGEEAKD